MAASEEEVKIPTITKAELAGSYWSKHINFCIEVPDFENKEGAPKLIRRRYNDFIWLRDWIVDSLPGAFVPSIPPKLAIALWPQGYLAQRKRELQWFIKRCSSIPYINNTECYQLFLNTEYDTNFKGAKKTFDNANKKLVRKKQFENLTGAFTQYEDAEMPENWEETTNEHLGHVQMVISCYDRMLSNSEDLTKHLTSGEENLEKLMESRKTLHDLEHTNISEDRFLSNILTNEKPSVDNYFAQTRETSSWWVKCLNRIWIPVLKKNYLDLKCIEEGMLARDKIFAELQKAETVAAKWKTEESEQNLRAKDVEQKLIDIDNEEVLKKLYDLCVKVLDNHRKMIQKMNSDRWTSGVLTLQKHQVPKWQDAKTSWFHCHNEFQNMISELDANVPVVSLSKKNVAEDIIEPKGPQNPVPQISGSQSPIPQIHIPTPPPHKIIEPNVADAKKDNEEEIVVEKIKPVEETEDVEEEAEEEEVVVAEEAEEENKDKKIAIENETTENVEEEPEKKIENLQDVSFG